MPAVVGPDALPEGFGADDAAQHMQGPGALLIRHARGHLAHVGQVVVHDAVVGPVGVEPEDAIPAPFQSADELVSTVGVLDVEQGEVGGESLAQPHIVPIVLSNRVAEPLVGHFVDDDVAPADVAGAGD